MSRTVANNIFFNLLKKNGANLEDQSSSVVFRHVGWTWTDPDLHKNTKS